MVVEQRRRDAGAGRDVLDPHAPHAALGDRGDRRVDDRLARPLASLGAAGRRALCCSSQRHSTPPAARPTRGPDWGPRRTRRGPAPGRSLTRHLFSSEGRRHERHRHSVVGVAARRRTPPGRAVPRLVGGAARGRAPMRSTPLPGPAALRAVGSLPLARAERIAEWYLGDQHAPADALKRALCGAQRGAADARSRRHDRTPSPAGSACVTLVDTARGAVRRRRRAVRRRPPSRDDHAARRARRRPAPAAGRRRRRPAAAGSSTTCSAMPRSASASTSSPNTPPGSGAGRCLSPTARPAAFCELVGRVTAYVLRRTKPARPRRPGRRTGCGSQPTLLATAGWFPLSGLLR